MTTVAPRLVSASLHAAAFGAEDPSSTRTVYAMVIGLVAVGLLLILLGVWIIRQTRPDLEVLAPLERMGDRDWRKKDSSTQRRMLDELRPEGAEPLARASKPPSIDADFEQADHPVTSFSDLGPGVPGDQRDPTPVEADALSVETDASPVEADALSVEADAAPSVDVDAESTADPQR